MKLGFSACNFGYRPFFENLHFAKAHGFDFVEMFGPEIEFQLSRDNGRELANTLRTLALTVTIHHALPDPGDTARCAAFRETMQRIRTLIEKERDVVSNLSFDTWVDRERSQSVLCDVLALFSDTDLPILTEDFPLNERDASLWKDALVYPNYGILSDLGHTNVRLCGVSDNPFCTNEAEGAPLPVSDNSPAAFYNAFLKKPLPVREIHVHNNSGKNDEHYGIPDGTADFAGIASKLKSADFDGYVTLELSPMIHGITGDAADKQLLRDRDLWLAYWND